MVYRYLTAAKSVGFILKINENLALIAFEFELLISPFSSSIELLITFLSSLA